MLWYIQTVFTGRTLQTFQHLKQVVFVVIPRNLTVFYDNVGFARVLVQDGGGCFVVWSWSFFSNIFEYLIFGLVLLAQSLHKWTHSKHCAKSISIENFSMVWFRLLPPRDHKNCRLFVYRKQTILLPCKIQVHMLRYVDNVIWTVN